MRFRITPNGFRRRVAGLGVVRAIDESGDAYTSVAGAAGVMLAGTGHAVALAALTAVGTLSLAAEAAPTGIADIGGTSGLAFDAGGTLKDSNIQGGTSSIYFQGQATPAAIGGIRGTAPAGFTATGNLSGVAIAGGAAGVAFDAMAQGAHRFGNLNALVNVLAFDATAKPLTLTYVEGVSALTFSTTGQVSVAGGKRFNAVWGNVILKRRELTNAIAANNRYLAKQAGTAATANANAIIDTNIRVNQTQSGVDALASRTASLESQIPNLASSSAVQTLTTTVTQQGNQIAANSSEITALQADLADKASSSAVQALTATVTQQGETITANSTAITSINSELPNKASASALASLTATVTQQGDTLTANSQSIGFINAALPDKADVSVTDYHSAVLTSHDGQITANGQAITAVQAEVAGKASASAVQALTTTVTEQGNDLAANSNLLSLVQAELGNKAEASAVSYLNSVVGVHDGQITSHAQAITAVQAEVAGKANASALQSLDAEVDTLTGKVNASYTLSLNANGKITGIRWTNDGSVSDAEFLADNFRVVTADGYGLSLDKTRMDRRFTGVAIYEGNAFGADNLAFWIGPNTISKSGATKANAAFWVDYTGANGGGSAIAGATAYFNQATAADNAISTATAVFTRNPSKVREITATLGIFANSTKFSNDGTATTSFITPFVIEVSRDGGAWTQLGGVNTCNGALVRNNAEPGVTYYSADGRGTATLYDNGDGTNIQYRARETGNMPTVGTITVPNRTITIKVTEI